MLHVSPHRFVPVIAGIIPTDFTHEDDNSTFVLPSLIS